MRLPGRHEKQLPGWVSSALSLLQGKPEFPFLRLWMGRIRPSERGAGLSERDSEKEGGTGCSLPISQTGRLMAMQGLCCCPQILTTALVHYSLWSHNLAVSNLEWNLGFLEHGPLQSLVWKGWVLLQHPEVLFGTCCPKGRWHGDRALHSSKLLPISSHPDGSRIPCTGIHSPVLQGSLWAEGSPRPAASFVPAPPPRRLPQPGRRSSQAGRAGALLGAPAPSRGGRVQPRKQGKLLWEPKRASCHSSPGFPG